MSQDEFACWVCNSRDLKLETEGSDRSIVPEDLLVTDDAYGQSLSRWRCLECGFLFCPESGDPTVAYEDMADPEYESTRAERLVQAGKLMQLMARHVEQGSLLDVGAGSGIFVEAARAAGFDAVGIEPSRWMVDQARERNLPVHAGVLPHEALRTPFDAVLNIDVIEHVSDPAQLLIEMRKLTRPDGTILVVTPDVDSLAAKIMGQRWWHFRTAHIGYFNRSTLNRLLERCGLRAVAWKRPTWYFPVYYLVDRLSVYFPPIKKLPLPSRLLKATVPLNLFDSWLVVVQRADDGKEQ